VKGDSYGQRPQGENGDLKVGRGGASRAARAPVEPGMLNDENARANPRMFAALSGKTRDS
jgi:hypothetical protein